VIGNGYYRYRSPFSAEVECAPIRFTVYRCTSCGTSTTVLREACNSYDFDRDRKCGGSLTVSGEGRL
jgi:hypothetical protein